jgi:hypothetical protein
MILQAVFCGMRIVIVAGSREGHVDVSGSKE